MCYGMCVFVCQCMGMCLLQVTCVCVCVCVCVKLTVSIGPPCCETLFGQQCDPVLSVSLCSALQRPLSPHRCQCTHAVPRVLSPAQTQAQTPSPHMQSPLQAPLLSRTLQPHTHGSHTHTVLRVPLPTLKTAMNTHAHAKNQIFRYTPIDTQTTLLIFTLWLECSSVCLSI